MKNLFIAVMLILVGAASQAASEKNRVTVQEKSQRVVNLSIEPLSVLTGMIGLEGNIYIHPQVAVGITGSFLAWDHWFKAGISGAGDTNYSFAASTLGVQAVIGLRRSLLENSWYISPGLIRNTIEARDIDLGLNGEADILSGRFVVGYQWIARSGFTARLGGGVVAPLSQSYRFSRSTNGSVVEERDLQGFGEGIILEAKLGWAF